MQDFIERLRAFDLDFNPPPSEAGIEALQSGLECRLPDESLALYRDHDGHRRCGQLEWRLLPAAEALDLYRGVFQNRGRYGLRFLWYDGQSNYAGVYADGPLQGRVCIEQHDNLPSPGDCSCQE